MKYIDLHVHSSCSDGTFTPARLVEYAKEKNLAAFALTDHDTAQGLKEAKKAAEGSGIEVVPGIEFSTSYKKKDIHILGLDIDPTCPAFKIHLAESQRRREIRNEKMARLLQTREGFDISMDQLKQAYGDVIITRAHFGRYLFEQGYVPTIREAFARYIGDDCPCFIPRERTDPSTIIHLIRNSGGIPILAHPLLYHLSEEKLEALTLSLKAEGLLGLEAIYSSNVGQDESRLRRLARKLELKISGGSDFHGSNKPLIDLGTGKGNLKIPYSVLEELRS